MTATITYFDGTSTSAAKTALETLAPASGDFVIFWQIGSTTFVAKVK